MATRSITSTGTDGKHVVIVASREELSAPSKVTLPEPEPAPGLILADGSINWGCPCLGGMATGPCGTQFRDAFSCFHYSEADPKGSDCYEKFSVMQECMGHFPELYGKDEDDDLASALDAAQGSEVPSATAQGSEVPSEAAQGSEVPSEAAQGSEVPSEAAQGSEVPSEAAQGSEVTSPAAQGSGDAPPAN